MSRNERNVQFYDFYLTAKTTSRDPSLKDFPFPCPVDFLTLITHWQELRDRNEARKKVQNNRKELYFADLDFDNPSHPDHVVLLINITDTTIANRVIRDIHSNERFPEDRPDSQGVDYSSIYS